MNRNVKNGSFALFSQLWKLILSLILLTLTSHVAFTLARVIINLHSDEYILTAEYCTIRVLFLQKETTLRWLAIRVDGEIRRRLL